MLSQFTKEFGSTKKSLADLSEFPTDVYPVGRLDADSEGLLIITNDKTITDKLLNPVHQHKRTYLVQVEGEITDQACAKLSNGVSIRVKKKEMLTAPANAVKVNEPDWLPERNPPVRFRANIPTSWIELTLTEGKNRQVRRMTAAVGYPTLRLVRKSIENLDVRAVLPQSIIEIERKMLFEAIGL